MSEQDRQRMLRGYERMLHRLQDYLKDHGLQDALERAKQRTVELNELSREEADQVGEYLRRDVEEAGQYLADTDRNLSDWLHMDIQMIENWLWDAFSQVADQTKLQLLELKRQASEPQAYASGEIAGPGALRCLNCGRVIEFKQADHVPHCPECHHTRFVRPAGFSAED